MRRSVFTKLGAGLVALLAMTGLAMGTASPASASTSYRTSRQVNVNGATVYIAVTWTVSRDANGYQVVTPDGCDVVNGSDVGIVIRGVQFTAANLTSREFPDQASLSIATPYYLAPSGDIGFNCRVNRWYYDNNTYTRDDYVYASFTLARSGYAYDGYTLENTR